MLISGFLYAVLAALVKWGGSLGYSSAVVLLYRASFQLVFALITAAISIEVKSQKQQYTNQCSLAILCNIDEMILDITLMNKKRKQKVYIPHIHHSFAEHSISRTIPEHSISDAKQSLDTFISPMLTPVNAAVVGKAKKKKLSTAKLWIAIICRGVFGATATFTYFESADLIPIGSATTLISLSCITASFFGWIFIGDNITKFHCLALFFGIIGAALISQPAFIFGNSKSNEADAQDIGYVVALSSALMGGFVYLTIRIAKKAPLWVLICCQALCCIALSCFLIFVLDFDGCGFKGINFKDSDEIFCILGIGVVGFVAQWTMTKGAQKLIAGVSSLLRSSTNMTCSFLLQILIFSTYPDMFTVIGAIVAISAVIIISLEKVRQAKNKELLTAAEDDEEYDGHGSMWGPNASANEETAIRDRFTVSK